MGGRVQVTEALEAGNVDTVLEQPDPGPALMVDASRMHGTQSDPVRPRRGLADRLGHGSAALRGVFEHPGLENVSPLQLQAWLRLPGVTTMTASQPHPFKGVAMVAGSGMVQAA